MKAEVSQFVIDELEVRADCLEDEEPVDAGLLRVAIVKIKAGEKPSAAESRVIEEEMRVMETSDLFTVAWRDWYAAMAWFGLLTPFDTKAVYSGRRPKRVEIDGIEYECWR
jgi:hypothetical protein